MIRYILSFIVCTFLLLAHPAVATTNLLAIHLIKEKVLPQWTPGTMPAPGTLKLVSPPLLADADFVSFDLTNQTFTLTPDAAKRLYANLHAETPFVLKASGEPVYVGAFYSEVSSSSFAGPVILPEHEFTATNTSFLIELGYGGVSPGQLADPRRDNRIVSAVGKLLAHNKP
jgi:hypothetical protein